VTVPVALTIAGKDLRQRFRDRSAVVLGFVAPLVIAALMSFAFKSSEHFHFTLGVVAADRGPQGSALVTALSSPAIRSVITVKAVATESAAAQQVRSGDVAAALVIPAGFSAAVTSGAAASLPTLTSVNHVLAGQVTASIAASFVAQLNADRLAVVSALATGTRTEMATLVTAASALHLPLVVATVPSGSRPLKAISYFGPAMGIFFVFFAISFSSRSWFIERRAGTLERIAAAARPATILLGKSLSVFVYGTASLTTMAVFTTVVFGADWGGPLLGAVLCLSMVLAVVALTGLVIAVARTERQAEGFASIIVFTLALMGGNFMFAPSAPALLRRLALFTPNGWALRGFVDVSTGPHSFAAVTGPALAMLGFSALVAALTVALSRRLVVT
jgi:ABC-2 type transport system permease protein